MSKDGILKFCLWNTLQKRNVIINIAAYVYIILLFWVEAGSLSVENMKILLRFNKMSKLYQLTAEIKWFSFIFVSKFNFFSFSHNGNRVFVVLKLCSAPINDWSVPLLTNITIVASSLLMSNRFMWLQHQWHDRHETKNWMNYFGTLKNGFICNKIYFVKENLVTWKLYFVVSTKIKWTNNLVLINKYLFAHTSLYYLVI